MDSSLAILIGGTAIFAGTVAYLVLVRDLGRRRAALAATAVAEPDQLGSLSGRVSSAGRSTLRP